MTFSEDWAIGKAICTPEMKPYFWSPFLQSLQQLMSWTEVKFRSALHMKSTGSIADSALSPSQQVECFCAWAMQYVKLFLVWLSCVSQCDQRHTEAFSFLWGMCQGDKNAWQICHKSTLGKSLVGLVLIFNTHKV